MLVKAKKKQHLGNRHMESRAKVAKQRREPSKGFGVDDLILHTSTKQLYFLIIGNTFHDTSFHDGLLCPQALVRRTTRHEAFSQTMWKSS